MQHLTLELETLTRDLFEEANRMVSHEARLRAELESSNQRLSADLETVIRTLEHELSLHRDRVSPAGYGHHAAPRVPTVRNGPQPDG